MRAFPLLPIAMLACLLAGCATAGFDGPVALDQTQSLGRLDVTPIKVEEDSRCPDPACTEPGKLVVRAVVDGAGFSQVERQFVLGRPAPVDARRWLVLESAEPGPSQQLTAFTGGYRFVFREVPPPPGS